MNDETSGSWPLYTVLDAIANGKNVSITSAGSSFRQEHEPAPDASMPESIQSSGEASDRGNYYFPHKIFKT